ncbi:MAG: N-acetyl sugar amidotransferase [Candidatus Atribacteria bacterium]|nr:N-acetyl sugar amidotransferase [Candidatus Atribacteria bacterium]
MKVCSKGIWNETIPGITFDENGISNFCKLQENMMETYPRGDKGLKDWEDIIARMKQNKGKGIYHCVVGVSGGVDSSYLMVLLKEAGLNPLAVNLDNGFNSEITVQNIYKITKKLNIDLETYVINYEEIKDLLRSYIKAGLPWVDTPTDMAIKAVMYKVALKEKIKFIIRGNDFRSEGKQPKEWTYSDTKQLKYIHKTFGNNVRLRTYPMLSFPKMIYAGLIKKVKDVRPFYYLDYQKQAAKVLLQEKYEWKDYGGHHHENLFTKFVMAYWLPEKFNIDKRLINLSAQILSGAISREKALELIEVPFATKEELLELRHYTLKKLDISEGEFDAIWNAPNKKTFDYPSNYNLIYGLAEMFSPIIKRIFDYKPMSLTEREVIGKEINK